MASPPPVPRRSSEPTPGPSKGLLAPGVLPFGPVVFVVISLFTLVVLGVFYALGNLRSAPDAPEATADGDVDRIPRKPRVDVVDDGDLARLLPEETRDDLQNELRTWFQANERRPIDDRSGADEEEWVGHLLSDDVTIRLSRLPAHVFADLSEPDRVLHEPGPHRGSLVAVWGQVQTADAVQLPVAPPTGAWRVRMLDEKGRPWTVTTLREPAAAVVPGSWARAVGVLTKLYPVDGRRPSFGLFTPQALAPSFPPFEAKAIDPQWAADVADATLEESQRKPSEETAFWYLCNYVRTLGSAGYRDQVASGALKPLDATGSRTITEIVNAPVLHRFRALRLRAAPLHRQFGVEAGFDENVGHIREIFRGYVVDDRHRPIWVVSPLPASEFRFDGARLVDVDGFFYKRMATKGESGNQYWLPVVVATSIRPYAVHDADSGVWAQAALWTVMAGAVVLMALWIRLLLRNRAERAATLRRHRERVEARAKSRSSGAGETV